MCLNKSKSQDAPRRHLQTPSRAFPSLPKCKNTGIERRYSARPIDWFERGLDWTERTTAYLDSATGFFIAAAENALARANCRARDVDRDRNTEPGGPRRRPDRTRTRCGAVAHAARLYCGEIRCAGAEIHGYCRLRAGAGPLHLPSGRHQGTGGSGGRARACRVYTRGRQRAARPRQHVGPNYVVRARSRAGAWIDRTSGAVRARAGLHGEFPHHRCRTRVEQCVGRWQWVQAACCWLS